MECIFKPIETSKELFSRHCKSLTAIDLSKYRQQVCYKLRGVQDALTLFMIPEKLHGKLPILILWKHMYANWTLIFQFPRK